MGLAVGQMAPHEHHRGAWGGCQQNQSSDVAADLFARQIRLEKPTNKQPSEQRHRERLHSPIDEERDADTLPMPLHLDQCGEVKPELTTASLFRPRHALSQPGHRSSRNAPGHCFGLRAAAHRHGLKAWIEAAKKRLHHNVLAVALANKLARIAWSVLARGRAFEASRLQTA
jgi:hypothetical protein